MAIRYVAYASVCVFALLEVVVFGTENPDAAQFHRALTSRALKFYFGVEDHSNVPTYTFGQPHKRAKTTRDVTSSTLQYQLDVFGEEFLLDLEPNFGLISPGFHIQYIADNGTWLETQYDYPCYFGSSANHNDSRAFIGIMNEQLTGFIQYDNVTLIIIPVLEDDYDKVDELSEQENTNPHLIYTLVSDSTQDQMVDYLRKKRNVYEPHYLELHVVADYSMFAHHGDDTEEYIIMMLNEVAGLYKDLGVNIELFLSKITVLTEPDPTLYVDENSEKALKNFANWMKPKYVADDMDPMHFDAAALITRVDFYNGEDGNRENTGLGYKWGACDIDYMYSVNEDSGPMTLILTLAHELGHNLGMRHDGDMPDCPDSKFIMSGYPAVGPNAVRWSPCSSAAITAFLNSPNSTCLNDPPTSDRGLALEPNKPVPGLIYGSDKQCQMIFGNAAEDCIEIFETEEDKCKELKCLDPSKSLNCLRTPYSRPPLSGTSCGVGKWCMSGYCQDKPKVEDVEEEFEPDEEEEEFLDENDSWEKSSEDEQFWGYTDDWLWSDDDDMGEGKTDQYGNDETDNFGNPTNTGVDQYGNPVVPGTDQYGNPISQNIDQYGNPIYPGQDQYGNPVSAETDIYGNPVNQEQPNTDIYGNPVNQEQPNTDIYGNPINQEQPKTDIYGNPINQEQDQYGNPVQQETDIYGNPVISGEDQYGEPNTATDQYGNPLPAKTDIYGNPINQEQDQYGNPANQQTDVYGNPVISGEDQFGRTEQPGVEQPTTQAQLERFVIGWYVGDFDECSAPCGGGNRTRTVICALHNSTYPIELQEEVCYQDVPEKPPTTEVCNEQSCYMTHFLLQNDTVKFGTVVIGLAFLVLASLLVFIGIYRRYRPHAFSSSSHKYAQLATEIEGSDI